MTHKAIKKINQTPRDRTIMNELITKCVEVASTALGERETILQIRRGEPTFGRNYTAHYKVNIATLDGSGVNPTNQRCIVVSLPVSDLESSRIDSRSCDSVEDLE